MQRRQNGGAVGLGIDGSIVTLQLAHALVAVDSHQQRVAENKTSTDKFWKEREEQRYKRLMEGYEAGTRRLKALAPWFWRRAWWY